MDSEEQEVEVQPSSSPSREVEPADSFLDQRTDPIEPYRSTPTSTPTPSILFTPSPSTSVSPHLASAGLPPAAPLFPLSSSKRPSSSSSFFTYQDLRSSPSDISLRTLLAPHGHLSQLGLPDQLGPSGTTIRRVHSRRIRSGTVTSVGGSSFYTAREPGGGGDEGTWTGSLRGSVRGAILGASREEGEGEVLLRFFQERESVSIVLFLESQQSFLGVLFAYREVELELTRTRLRPPRLSFRFLRRSSSRLSPNLSLQHPRLSPHRLPHLVLTRPNQQPPPSTKNQTSSLQPRLPPSGPTSPSPPNPSQELPSRGTRRGISSRTSGTSWTCKSTQNPVPRRLTLTLSFLSSSFFFVAPPLPTTPPPLLDTLQGVGSTAATAPRSTTTQTQPQLLLLLPVLRTSESEQSSTGPTPSTQRSDLT